VPRLIHLNGPPGVGKSTVAQWYADRHPGVLNLDADQVISLIGGWRDDFPATLGPARQLAIGMAATHLGGGRDVVMPQLIARATEAARFAAVARDSGARYQEIVLTSAKRTALDRFVARHGAIDEVIACHGGPALVSESHDRLTAYLSARPDSVVVATDDLDVERTYQAVLTALARFGGPVGPPRGGGMLSG
jgi:predicted kinase